MARIKDLWLTAKDRTPTARYGKGKRWLLEYRDPTGAVRTEAFARKPDAEARLVDVQADVQRSEYIDPRRGQIRFRSLAAQWVSGRIVADSTATGEASVLNHLNEEFGDYPVSEIRPSHVKQWFARQSKQLADATMNMRLWYLRSILDLAVEDDMIRKNPTATVRRRPKVRPPFELWTLGQIRAILEHFEGSGMWPVPALAAGAGLRQGEGFGIGLDDINFLRRTLHVRQQVQRVHGKGLVFAPPKRDSFGAVPLDVELVDALAAHVAAHPPAEVTLPWSAIGAKAGETRTVRLLAAGPRGAVPRRDTFSTQWLAALTAAGITPAGKATGIHVLRHAYASYRIAEGMPITVVQARLRHRRLAETYETYAHLTFEEQLPDAIASLFRSVPVPFRSVSVT